MLNDKWTGEGIVRLLGRDGSVFVQGAVNQVVETARILPRICAVISFGFVARAESRSAEENELNGSRLSTENSEEPFAAKRRIRRITTRAYALHSNNITQFQEDFCRKEPSAASRNQSKWEMANAGWERPERSQEDGVRKIFMTPFF
jgi:hypothetical protein